jgi:hypothetical protein
VSRDANDRGRFVVVKTRVTAEEERGAEEKRRLYVFCQRLVTLRQDKLV